MVSAPSNPANTNCGDTSALNSPHAGPRPHARFVWVKDDAPSRNQFVRFERTFELAEVPRSLPLNLFADTRYRLRINGDFVASGPGRFVTQFPEFDRHDLAPRLRPGTNKITVEVNFFGASSYQSMPDGAPGFIAWGGGPAVDLATPGNWRAFRLNAWRSDAPLFSFAQNPVEICDTRLSEAGDPRPLVPLSGKAAPWGDLAPYSGAPIPFLAHRPKRIELAGRLISDERRFGFMSHDDNSGRGTEKPWRAFATWIRSPRDQTVILSCFWSELLCNGVPVPVDTNTPCGNHGHCTVALREGWNLLTGEICVLTEFWAYCLGIPVSAGLSLHGRRDSSCAAPFALSPNSPRAGLLLPIPADTEPPESWSLHDGNIRAITPARLIAWEIPEAGSMRNIALGRLPETSTIESAEATWCFSFAGELLGHIVLDVEAPAGAILDVACDDWQSPHGGVALYRSNPFTDAADRFILRGGRQRVELFHPRGGKLIQVVLRAPHGAAPLSLHDVFVRSRQTLGADETRFSSDHPVLDWAWPVALRTLIASTDEAYSDCPWRERGSYIGDSYVNIHLNLLLNGDYRTARRTLRIFAQAQLPDGQLACCAPAWLRRPHEDFTLVWLLALHDFWAATGDTTLASELWPVVRRIWDSPSWERHISGLWNTSGTHLFVDWGALPTEREGEANAIINLFRFGAARACARLATALGRDTEAATFDAQATAVESALFSLLWNDTEGRLLPSLKETTAAVHANTLALAFGLGPRRTRERILAYLEPKLRDNFAKGLRDGQAAGHLELYFLNYLLPALAAHGRPDLAELLIDQHYGFLRNIGDDTLPECFCRVAQMAGSRCHSWSGAPAIYAARQVLGLRQITLGNPNDFVFDPVVHGINRASGRIAHPLGWIEISWRRENGVIHPTISAPAGISIGRVAAGVPA
ncbi:MAG: hypothetical protein WC661_02225 [Opitutaceae bacterium]|jgi:hypothetical protein